MRPTVGLFPLYTPDDPTIDVVAVHGLHGDAFKTWSNEAEGCWLRDLLPKNLKSARVCTYGYDARVFDILGTTSADRILSHAHTLVAELASNRQLENAEQRPLIFICHSLGGVIVKRALIYAKSRTSKSLEHLHSVFAATYGILFLGTPHEGSNQAKIAATSRRIIDAVVPKKIISTSPQLLEALNEHSEILQDITCNFAPLMKEFEIYFFWEQLPTSLPHTTDYVVPESSAAPILDGIGRASIAADHRNMCKFDSPASPGYSLVVGQLVRLARDAPGRIARRWVQTAEQLKIRREYEAAELLR